MAGDYYDFGAFLRVVPIDVEVSGSKGGGAFTTEAPIRLHGPRRRMQGILKIGVCPSGLRIGIMRAFGPFSRNFFVPWEEIKVERKHFGIVDQ